MSLFDNPSVVKTDEVPTHGWNTDIPSRAVVACDGEGHGCVVWDVGFWIENEVEQLGTSELSDLGLDDAPQGISIWEGKYVYYNINHPLDPIEVDSEVAGTFRDPTPEEWALINQKRAPWNEEDWKRKI